MAWNRDYIRKKLSSQKVQKIIAIIEKRMAEGVKGVPLSTEEIIRLGDIVASMAATLHEALDLSQCLLN